MELVQFVALELVFILDSLIMVQMLKFFLLKSAGRLLLDHDKWIQQSELASTAFTEITYFKNPTVQWKYSNKNLFSHIQVCQKWQPNNEEDANYYYPKLQYIFQTKS